LVRWAGDIDPDACIVPADVLSRQALEGQAEDLALEDALYSLDKALQAGALQPAAYIKQARALLMLGRPVAANVWLCCAACAAAGRLRMVMAMHAALRRRTASDAVHA
jgi:hypothetical protein